MSTAIKPQPFRGGGALSDMTLNEDYLHALGVYPFSSDDTQFGVSHVYCSAHMRTHSAGWCTVPNSIKLPVNEDLPMEYRSA